MNNASKLSILIIYPHGNALNPRAGAETRIWSFISSLVSLNFKVSVLHSIKSKGLEDIYLKKKINVYYYRDLDFFGLSDWYFTDLNPFFIIKLFNIIRKERFDIIQIEFPWGLISTKLLAKTTTTIVYDSLGVESEFMKIAISHPNFPKLLKPLAYSFSFLYEKVVCKLADVIINVSNIDRDNLIRKYNIKKNKTFLIQIPSVIHKINPINFEEIKLKNRTKLGLPKDKVIIIFHGGLPHPPNQEAFNLIENYISVNIKKPDILFVLAGNNLKKYEKRNIRSLGFIDNLDDLLYAADFAIIPIISGSGMRVKCADYITAALPFITTKKGIEGIDFLLNGIHCLIYDTVNDDFLNGVYQLYKNINLREKFRINLSKKSNILSINTIQNRIYKLYQKIIQH